MQLEAIKDRIAHYAGGVELDLIVNDNRTRMLAVQRQGKKSVRLSMHRIFLHAPDDIVHAIAMFIIKRDRQANSKLQAYIQAQSLQLDYSQRLDVSSLETKGDIWDLKELYDEVNANYFQSNLDLHISWYGSKENNPRQQVTFGLYIDGLKLIKIHRLLDTTFFPRFFVTFVIYHEMLHHIIPPHVDDKGVMRCHSREFKAQEKRFNEFKIATQWLKHNKIHLFSR